MSIEHPSFGKLDEERIIIFDTTLRDGEQSPGFSMNINEKIRMAEALTELGVDVMEAGFPIASIGDYESVKAIAETIGQRDDTPVICGLARSGREDILRAADAVRPARRKRIHSFLSTSPLHMKYKLRMEPDDVLAAVTSSVELARQFTDDVEWSAEDGTRTEPEFLCRCVEAAIKAGATTINIPDTVGYALPEDMERIFTMIRTRVPGADAVVLSTHNHNDLGLAVANTIAAIRAGVRQIESTINGIGERAGNAALEEIVMAMKTRHDQLPFETKIHAEKLFAASQMLTEFISFGPQPNKAIVGENAFAHEAGIHQDGYLKNPSTYEIINPASVGVPETRLVLGKHSGRHALKKRAEDLGFTLTREELDEVYTQFTIAADTKKGLRNEEISRLVREVISRVAGDQSVSAPASAAHSTR